MLELTETVDLEADSGDSKPIEDMQKQNFILKKKKKATYNPTKKIKNKNGNNNRKQYWPENNEMKNEFEGGRNSKISKRERDREVCSDGQSKVVFGKREREIWFC